MSSDHSYSEAVVELAEEFLDRYRAGERPAITEYTSRFPQLADEIREVFPALAMMENIAINEQSMGKNPIDKPSAPELKQLGDYRIMREVGRGGMGVVYEAEQISLGRHVALKVLPSSALADSNSVRRFKREAKSAAKLHHTNIVPVFGVGEQSGLHYYVMQFIQGLSLDEVIGELKKLQPQPTAQLSPPLSGESPKANSEKSVANVALSLMTGNIPRTASFSDRDALDATFVPTASEKSRFEQEGYATNAASKLSDSSSGSIPLPSSSDASKKPFTYWESVANIGFQLADALQYAHEQGILHRDIKPGNLILDLKGTTWITDFGLAKATDQQDITHTGDILGTLRYMPPEAFEGNTDSRSDVYSLGLTLFEMLSFRPAFGEKDRHQLIRQVTTEAAPRLNKINPSIPRDLVTVIHKAIERDLSHRYQTAEEFGEDLRRYLNDEPIRARRISPIERITRWSRRNKGLAASLAVVIVLLLIINIAGPFMTWRLKQSEIELGNTVSALEDNEKKLSRTINELTSSQVELRQATAQAKTQAEKMRALAASEKRLAQEKEQDRQAAYAAELNARKQYYASDSSNASYAARTGDQYTRLKGYLQRWKKEQSVTRGWEYYNIFQQIHLPAIEFDFEKTHGGGWAHLHRVDWSPDGRYIVTGGTTGRVEVFDARLGELVWRTRLGNLSSIDWSPNGEKIACGMQNGRLTVLDVKTQQVLKSAFAHRKLRRVRWSSNGRHVATCGDADVVVWDANTWQQVQHFQSLGSPVIDISWNAENQNVMACAQNGVVRIWEAASGKLLQEIKHEGTVTACAWNSDGTQVAFASPTHAEITVRDLASNTILKTLSDDRLSQIKELAFSPDGHRLATIGGNTRTLWDMNTGRLLDIAAQSKMNGLAWNTNGTELATVGDQEKVQIWPADRTSKPRLLAGATHFHWGPSGQFFATSDGQRITLWDAYGWEQVATFPDHPGRVTALCLSADEQWVASADDQNVITIWDQKTRKPRHRLTVEETVYHLAASPDGNWLSSLSLEQNPSTSTPARLQVWDTRNWQEATPDYVKVSQHLRQSWSADSRYIVAGGWLKRSYIGHYGVWDAVERKWEKIGSGWMGRNDVSWSPDGKQIALTADSGSGLEILDVRQGDGLFSVANGRLIKAAHGKSINRVDWSPAGRRLVTVGDAHLARIWDLESLQQVHEIENAMDAVWGPFGVRLAVRTKSGVEIHDASIGAARGRWTRLLPLLDRQMELGRLTAEDLRTKIEIHVANEDWNDAIQAVTRLEQFKPEEIRSQLCVAQVCAQYAQRLAKSGNLEESEKFLQRTRDIYLKQFTSEPGIDSRVRRLAQSLEANKQPGWSFPEPLQMSAAGGETLTVQDDGSIFVSGPNPDRAVYTVKLRTELPSISAFRLETIPDSRLPGNGAGRYEAIATSQGNFHIAEVTAAIANKGDSNNPQTIPIVQASADYSHRTGLRPISAAIDGNPRTYWDTYPLVTEPHEAIFEFQTPVEPHDGELIITLDSGLSQWGMHSLGRFRISLTGDPNATQVHSVRQMTDPWEKLGAALACESHPQKVAEMTNKILDRTPDHLRKAKVIKQVIKDEQSMVALMELRPKLIREIAESYSKTGQAKQANLNDEKALKYASKALALDPQNAHAYFVHAEVWQRQGKNDRAIEAYRKVLSIDPQDSIIRESQKSLAWIYITHPEENGKFHHIEEAVRYAQLACEAEPKNAESWNIYGIALLRADRYQDAVDALQRSIALGENGPATLLSLAMAKWGLGERGEALTWYDEAFLWRAQHPSDETFNSFFQEAKKLIGEVDLASLIGLDPKDASLYLRSGRRLGSQGNWHDALAAYRKAASLKYPDSSPIDDEDLLPILPLLLHSGDKSSFKNHRSRVLAGFTKATRPKSTGHAAILCLLMPLEESEWAPFMKLANEVVSHPDQTELANAAFVRGLMAYRTGEFKKAMSWSHKCLSRPETSAVSLRKAQCHLVIAMAHAQLGQSPQAVSAYEKSRGFLDDHEKSRQSGYDKDWADRMVAMNLKKELNSLLSEKDWHAIAQGYSQRLDAMGPSRLSFSPRCALIRTIIRREDPVFDALKTIRPEDTLLTISLARNYVLQNDWKSAVKHYPITKRMSVNEEWYEYAAALLLADETKEYRIFMEWAAAQVGDIQDPGIAFIIARAASMSKHCPIDPELLIRWAELSAKGSKQAWRLHVAGLAHYRAGNYEKALQRINEAKSWHPELHLVATALVYHALGNARQSREQLELAQKWFQEKETQKRNGYYPVQETDWLEANLLLREAEELISGK